MNARQENATENSWIENDLERGLGEARRAGKLAFVTWTTRWCPPCNELRCAVLDDPQFARQAAELVLVRLDGDAPGAQLAAERLRVRSYPSSLLLDAEGRERIRFPGGLKADEFCHVLDRAVAHPTHIADVVRLATERRTLSEADFEILAYHWWGIDEVHARGEERVPFLQGLFRECPVHLRFRMRLLVHGLWAASRHVGANAQSHEKGWGDSARFLMSALGAARTRYSDVYLLLVDPGILVHLGAEGSELRSRLDGALAAAAERLVAAGSLTPTETLISLSAVLALRTRRDGLEEARKAMAPRVGAAVLAADRMASAPGQRQTAMNMAGHLLRATGLVDEAVAVFQREVETSAQGPYFMPYLGEIAMQRGRQEEGIGWLRRSWQDSPPGNARFERGVGYLQRAAEVQGESVHDLAKDVLALLAEFGDAPDALSGRNRDAMRRLLAIIPKVRAQ